LKNPHRKRSTYFNNRTINSQNNVFFNWFDQSLSLIPGVSRSAATIVGAMLLKLKAADEFSFYWRIPHWHNFWFGFG